MSPLDISPRYAGVVHGIWNTIRTVPGIIGVTLTGLILDSGGPRQAVFALTSAIFVGATVVWLLFATGERVVD